MIKERLEEILEVIPTQGADKVLYSYKNVLTAMKIAVNEALNQASENVKVSLFDYIEGEFKEFLQYEDHFAINDGCYVKVNKESILKLKIKDYPLEEAKYNAQLISKAPEMFEALKKAHSTIQKLKSSMLSHVDCIESSEFANSNTMAQKEMEYIEQLLKESTEMEN